jgi:glycolate oxidase FAD binding subunit
VSPDAARSGSGAPGAARATTGADATRSFALGGVEPLAVRRPATREELAEALREAARDRLAVVPWGGGVGLAYERAPGRYDLALDLGALDRVVEYEPEDLTLTAECGATLASLRTALAARGQELPLEGARAGRATLGGVLAANASGARRLRLGAPRDRVLGARFALGDGTLARTGGRVVKNVAGYAVHRLLCGSRGSLAVLVEASLKLLPAPGRRTALLFGVSARELGDATRWAALPRLEPAVLTVVGSALGGALPVASPTGPFTLVVGFEDDEARVDELVAIVGRTLGEPDARLDDESAATLWQSLADLEEGGERRLTATGAANSPAALAPLLGTGAIAAGMVFHAPAGRLHVLPGDAPAGEVVAPLAGAGFTLVETAGFAAGEVPAGSGRAAQAAVQALRGRLRQALDPAGTMAFGPRWENGSPADRD